MQNKKFSSCFRQCCQKSAMAAPSRHGVAEIEGSAMERCMAWRFIVAGHGGCHSPWHHGRKSGLNLFFFFFNFWRYFRVLKWNPKSCFQNNCDPPPSLLLSFSHICFHLCSTPTKDPSDRQRPDSGDATCRWSPPPCSSDLNATSVSVILPLSVLLFCFLFCSIQFSSSILFLSALFFIFFIFCFVSTSLFFFPFPFWVLLQAPPFFLFLFCFVSASFFFFSWFCFSPFFFSFPVLFQPLFLFFILCKCGCWI